MPKPLDGVRHCMVAFGDSMPAAKAHQPPVTASRWQLHAPGWVALGIPLVLLGAYAAHYLPFFADDGFISLRYSERLLAGKGLTWSDGEAVEGYSNLLWVLACAALGLGFDLVTAARLLGFAAAIAMIAAVYRAFPAPTWRDTLPALAGGLVIALAGPVAVWSIGGLEATLFGGLWAWALVHAADCRVMAPRALLIASIPAALACWTRPEGPLLAAAIGLCLAANHLRTQRNLRNAVIVALCYGALPLAATGAQLVFRILYYGDWVPNTAHIKAAVTWPRVEDGLSYVWHALRPLLPAFGFAALGVYAAAISPYRRALAMMAALTGVLWLGYIASVGGDIFPASRHAVPAIVGIAFLSANGVRWLLDHRRLRAMAPGLLVAFAAAAQWSQQIADPQNVRAETERWEWDGEVVGKLWREGFGAAQPLLAVDPAGALVYYSGLNAIDMYGLCDRHIAMSPPIAKGWLAHDHGDGKYVLSREPDLIVFRLPAGGAPTSVSGRQIVSDPRFRSEYVDVGFDGHEPYTVHNRSHVRLTGRLGIQRERDFVRLPAYLLRGHGVRGHALADRSIGGLIDANSEAVGPAVDLDPGTWTIAVEPEDAPIALSLRTPAGIGKLESAATLRIDEATTIELVVATGILQTPLRALTLRRRDDARHTHTAAIERKVGGARDRLIFDRRVTSETALRPWEDPAFEPTLAVWSKSRNLTRDRHGGPWRVTTYRPKRGDRPQSNHRGPVFQLPEYAVISLEVQGGNWQTSVRLRDSADDRVLRAWHGDNSHRQLLIRSDLGEYAGRQVYLELYDRNSGPWGHISLRNVALWQRSPKTAPDPVDVPAAEEKSADTAPDDSLRGETAL